MTGRHDRGPRYAIYLCPDPHGAAWTAGADWLGRCAARGAARVQPAIPGLGRALQATLTAAPRRYGFHMTLKPPMRLARGTSAPALRDALEAFAARHRAFDGTPLAARLLRGFLALCPERDDPRVNALAARCVMELDAFRRPAGPAERRARAAARLTARQSLLLRRWGYPYVMDQFEPHYTLTGPLEAVEEALAERLREAAERHFGGVMRELLRVDAVALFEQRAPADDFRLLDRVRLAPRGRLIYVVGPSGAGKDSVMQWASERLPREARVRFARRTITRAPGPGPERHSSVDDGTFERLREAGHFALEWRAHGVRYGVPRDMLAPIDRGETVVLSGSRQHLPQLMRRFPSAEVVHVVASPAKLRGRLVARGREGPVDVESRMRRPAFVPLAETRVVEIVNEGALETAGLALIAAILRDPSVFADA